MAGKSGVQVKKQARRGLLVRVQFIEVPYPGHLAFYSPGAQ
jgi:hypothetical protein